MRLNKITLAVIPVVLLGIATNICFWKVASPNRLIDCAQKGACLPSFNNTSICETLRVGTPEHELIHQLGQPFKRKGDSMYFETGATEPGPIEIKLDDQRNAIKFFCRPGG